VSTPDREDILYDPASGLKAVSYQSATRVWGRSQLCTDGQQQRSRFLAREFRNPLAVV